MDLMTTHEQQDVAALARDFARREIAPHVADYDREERFPVEIVREAAELGLMGGVVPPEHGGAGLDHKTYAMVVEEISRVCHVVGVALTLPSGLVGNSILTFAHLGVDERSGRKRICAFIVDRDLPGVGVHPLANKFGFRPIKTGELVLDDVRVPADALVGEEGRGFAVAMNAVESGRLGVATRAVGLGQACVDSMVDYARERIVFGEPIAKLQMVQKMIADSLTEVEAARLLVLRLADLRDRGERARSAASMAKMYASDAALHAAINAFQVHGAYAVSDEYPVGRYLRDAKIFQIVEGNNELHRALIAEGAVGFR